MEMKQEYTRKAKKTGSSIQATIPADITKHLDIHEGDMVLFQLTDNGEVVLKKEPNVSKEMGVGEDFLAILQEGMTEYHQALEDLVER